MAARVRLEPDLAGEAAGGWFGLDPLGDEGGRYRRGRRRL
jgi:hypothetical protein